MHDTEIEIRAVAGSVGKPVATGFLGGAARPAAATMAGTTGAGPQVDTELLPLGEGTYIGVLRFSNPPVNALGKATVQGIHRALRQLKQHSNPPLAAIVLMPGEPASVPFSAGADIKEFDSSEAITARSTQVAPLAQLIEEVEDSDVPTIAAIRGLAFGGGLELALAAHYRLALPGTRLGLPEVKLGIIPGAGGTQRLPRLVGLKQALKIIVSGDPIFVTKALESGLIDEIIDAPASGGSTGHALLQGALTFTKTHAPLVARRTKDRQVAELASVRGAAAVDACKALAAKELKVAPVERGGEAQHGCIEAVAASGSPDIRDGLAVESAIFARLLQSDQSKARRYFFFSERATAHAHCLGEVPHPPPIRTVGVVGGGTMGSGILVAFLDAGVKQATLVEINQAALDQSLGMVKAIYASRARRGQMTAEQAAAVAPRIRGTLRLEDLGDADLVVEAVYEDLGIKTDVFARLDKICKPFAILASNTSTLSIDAIAAATSRPSRVLGMHFFSPAHIMKLVELVKGKDTAAEAIAAVATVSKKMRKVCVVVGNCFGFVGNRMLFPYKTELEFLVEEGACPYRIDKLLLEFGFPVGPFVMADIAGLDVAYRIRKAQGLHDPAKRDPKIRFTDLQDRLCQELGRMGQKNGKGWYRYDKAQGNGRTPLPDPEVSRFVERFRKGKCLVPRTDISDAEILERSLFALANEGLRCLREGVAATASDVDVIYAYGYGFPMWRGGPMHWAERTVGLPTLLSGLEKYYRRFPQSPWLKPAPLLEELVRKGQGLVARL